MTRSISILIILFIFLLFVFQVSLSFVFVLPSRQQQQLLSSHLYYKDVNNKKERMVVIGKIIVDEYGKPKDDEGVTSMTIGGGGPQAAWGAAIAMSHMDSQHYDDLLRLSPQPITFMGPVGSKDFSKTETNLLNDHLEGALDTPPKLLSNNDVFTPRIRLWHDATDGYDAIHWLALNDSFGKQGAQTLWSTQPTIHDIQTILSNKDNNINVLHVIIECGKDSPSKGWDHHPFIQDSIRKCLLHNNNNNNPNNEIWLSLEPIVHPNSQTQQISQQDAYHSYNILQSIIQYYSNGDTTGDSNTMKIKICISPDETLQNAWIQQQQQQQNDDDDENLWNKLLSQSFSSNVVDSWAIRKGSKGSTIVCWTKNSKDNRVMKEINVPAATLNTKDRQPINPTGAGNAYAAAYVTSLANNKKIHNTSSSSSLLQLEAACIATGVGAIVCEFSHLPPYSKSTLKRLQQAIHEVQKNSKEQNLLPTTHPQ